MSKQVTTTAKSGLIADNQYGKIYGSSPGGPTENKALTQKCVGALPFYAVPICSYGLEMFLIYLPIKIANFKWFMRITEELKT